MTTTITADQARAIARAFLDASKDLGRYRSIQRAALNADDLRKLEDDEWALLDLANRLETTATGLALGDLQDDVNAIIAATDRVRRVMAEVKEAKAVINLVAALVNLGTSLASQNPLGVASAIADTVAAIQELDGDDGAASAPVA